ncbi:MAG TPA: GTP-binding protein, partial [Gammaproteobacteria bacterium]|nr:GTP-binding protein [Gammaproteobacteria bacterium]
MSASRQFNLALIGPENSGKTTISSYFLDLLDASLNDSTIGLNYNYFTLNQNSIALWDNSGQENFLGITRQYYKNMQLAIFVLDSQRLVEDDYAYLINEYQVFKNASPDAPIILLINKVDSVNIEDKDSLIKKAEDLFTALGV